MLKTIVKDTLSSIGYKLTKLHKDPLLNSLNPYQSAKLLLKKDQKAGVFFDIGANKGQIIEKFNKDFPMARIYSFEPGNIYNELILKYKGTPHLTLENLGVGSKEGVLTFNINDHSDMSSFLPLTDNGWGTIIEKKEVTVTTIDSYCKQHEIQEINFLKIDTQGFDLEVLKGAVQMLPRIQFILIEVALNNLYEGEGSFADIYTLLWGDGFRVVNFYDLMHNDKILFSMDILFINPNF